MFMIQCMLLLLLYSTAADRVVRGRPPTPDDQSHGIVRTVYEQQELFLQCQSIVGDGEDVLWLRNGVSLSPPVRSANLAFPSLSRSDAGSYRCLKSNAQGAVLSPPTNLIVNYVEDFDSTDGTAYGASTSTRGNGYFVLRRPSVIASDGVQLSYAWFKDNTQVFDDSTHFITARGDLVVIESQFADIGSYKTIAAWNSAESFESKEIISPDYKVVGANDFNSFSGFETLSIVYYPEDQTIIRSESSTNATFDCIASKSIGVKTSWFMNGVKLDSSTQGIWIEKGGRRLVVNNPGFFSEQISAGPDYSLECKVSSDEGRLSDHKTIKIVYIVPPKPRSSSASFSSDVQKPLHSHWNRKCGSKKDVRTTALWYFNGRLIDSHRGKLAIDHLTEKDFGVYQCEVTNAAGSYMQTYWLKEGEDKDTGSGSIDYDAVESLPVRSLDASVEGDKPVFEKKPEDQTVPVGTDEVLLKCAATGTPTPEIEWKFNDMPIPSTSTKYEISKNGLIIHELKETDGGVYSCDASNAHGTMTSKARLAVNGGNLIARGPSNESILIGAMYDARCDVNPIYEGKAEIYWFHNNVPIPPTGSPDLRIERKGMGKLRISQVGPDNIGEFKCTIVAAGRNESAAAWLRIIEKPSMPVSVRADLVNDTLPAKIRVSWVEGFDGNDPIIRHSVQMRVLGDTGHWSEWETVADNIPSEECCSYLVDNIKPASTVVFRVDASNKHGRGKPSQPTANVTMPQQPPSAAPLNVKASARSMNSIMVQWQQPMEKDWSGVILGYVVRYRLLGYNLPWLENNVTTKDARNVILDKLITWRDYEIQVAAYNHRGLGVFSKSIEISTGEGTPVQAPKNVKAEVLNSTAVKVWFSSPDQQSIMGVNLGYKVQFWKGQVGRGFLFKKVIVDPLSSDQEVVVDGLEKFGHYNLSVLCFTNPGDGPSSPPIQIITDEDIPGGVDGLNIDEVMFNGAVVVWQPPAEPNGVILKYQVRYWNKATPSDKTSLDLDSNRRNVTIDGLESSTQYCVDVMATTRKGDGPREETKFESGVPPELPGRASSLSIYDVSARSAMLQFVPGFDGHTAIRQWIVEAKVADSSIFHTIFNISAPKARILTVTGLRPYTKYQLRIIAENVRGRGAPSEPSRQFVTKSARPEMLSSRLFAEPRTATTISLSWTPLLATQWNGEHKGYLIKYNVAGEDDTQEVRLNQPRASEYILTGLSPFTSYEIDLFAENLNFTSLSTGIATATTYESSPSGTPRNVQAEIGNGVREVMVAWEPVDNASSNGVILGYTVRALPEQEWLREDETKTIDVPGVEVLSTKVFGLRAFTTYHIFVSAYTIVGKGPENTVAAIVTTGEELPGPPSGVAFSLVSESDLSIKWTPPENPNGKIRGYIVRYWKSVDDRSTAKEAPLPATLYVFTANGLSADHQYTFTVQATNSIGAGPEAEVQVVTTSARLPLTIPPVPVKDDRTPSGATSIGIRWDEALDMETNDAPTRFVNVEYQPANSDDWIDLDKPLPGTLGSVIVYRLMPNTAYHFRIKFQGDSISSSWSEPSAWIRTLSAPPMAPPMGLIPSPYDSSSLLLQWQTPKKSTWNSDAIGYRISYRTYRSNETWKTEEIPAASDHPEKEQHILTTLASFRHFIVRMCSFNSEGDSPYSQPVFVYVGYSIPKRNITNLIAEPDSSSSIAVRWDAWEDNDTDVISGFRVRFVPVTSVLSDSSSEEQQIVVTNNSCLLTDLRKYTEYQISVSPYNRAGEGTIAQLRVRTLEDLPGPVGDLVFSDILLDSVRVSWTPPSQPNGVVTRYVVKYNASRMQAPDLDFSKEITAFTTQTFFPASELREGKTYTFTVIAETIVGRGTEMVDDVYVGPSPEGPSAPSLPNLVPGQTSVTLQWKDTSTTKLIGHLIQAKRIAKAVQERADAQKQRRVKRSRGMEPNHPLGEWITLKTIEGRSQSNEISYRELEPSSVYVFRIFARNERGVGVASPESERLQVPDSIPEDPFYTTWWFIGMVAMSTFVIIVVVIAFLCVTGSAAKYKRDKRNSMDSLQLADGNLVFQMKANQRNVGRSRNDLLTRPGTTQSWLTDPDPPAYGSVLGGRESNNGSVVNMYGLATDVIPSLPNEEAMKRLSTLVGRDVRGSAYVSAAGSGRIGLDMGSRATDYGSRQDFHNRSDFGRGDYGYGRRAAEYAAPISRGPEYEDDSFDEEENSVNGEETVPDGGHAAMAGHYGNDDPYRETWRRVKATEGVRSAVPPPAPGTASGRSTDSGSDNAWPQQAPNLASGFSSFV